jgi:hypothetical protein
VFISLQPTRNSNLHPIRVAGAGRAESWRVAWTGGGWTVTPAPSSNRFSLGSRDSSRLSRGRHLSSLVSRLPRPPSLFSTHCTFQSAIAPFAQSLPEPSAQARPAAHRRCHLSLVRNRPAVQSKEAEMAASSHNKSCRGTNCTPKARPLGLPWCTLRRPTCCALDHGLRVAVPRNPIHRFVSIGHDTRSSGLLRFLLEESFDSRDCPQRGTDVRGARCALCSSKVQAPRREPRWTSVGCE